VTCAKQIAPECSSEHYANDRACKECRKQMVRANRAANREYYRAYDRGRNMRPDRVEARREYIQTDAGKASKQKAIAKYNTKNPKKYAAKNAVNNAVRDGKLTKPDTCSECGAGGRIHGHHDDYSKPLEVRWLCPACHKAHHNTQGKGDATL